MLLLGVIFTLSHESGAVKVISFTSYDFPSERQPGGDPPPSPDDSRYTMSNSLQARSKV